MSDSTSTTPLAMPSTTGGVDHEVDVVDITNRGFPPQVSEDAVSVADTTQAGKVHTQPELEASITIPAAIKGSEGYGNDSGRMNPVEAGPSTAPLAQYALPGNSSNDHRDESVVDFLRAVPGPSETVDLAQADGPFTLLRRKISSAPPTKTTEAALDTTPLLISSDASSSLSGSGSTATSNNGRGAASTVHDSSIPDAGPPRSPTASGEGIASNNLYLNERNTYGSGQTAPATGGAPEPGRETRDFVLPRWQPDVEVTYCPICNTQFSFFVRKHHCRKCGRVVCNSCSPHRITIPHQYIVHPPEGPRPEDINPVSPGSRGGGLKVRLCNPCVPDPNTIPPQSRRGEGWRGPPPSYYIATGDRDFTLSEEDIDNLERADRGTVNGRPSNRVRASTQGISTTAQSISTAAQGGQRVDLSLWNSMGNTTTASGAGSSLPNSRLVPRVDAYGHQRPRASPYSVRTSSQARGHGSRHQSLSANLLGVSNTSHPQSNMSLDSTESGNRPLPPVPRIAEEDECPICHRELPLRSLPNFEEVRAQHVIQCIDEQIAAHGGGRSRPAAFSSNSSPPPLPQDVTAPSSSPAQRSTVTGGARRQSASIGPSHASSANQIPDQSSHHPIPQPIRTLSRSTATPSIPIAPIANTPEARMAAREQAHAAVVLGLSSPTIDSSSPGARRTGMFPYIATEKDCVDEAECTICLEEFEVGVAMARLECLCRFHKKCIEGWWQGKPGRCPVHQHDGWGF